MVSPLTAVQGPLSRPCHAHAEAITCGPGGGSCRPRAKCTAPRLCIGCRPSAKMAQHPGFALAAGFKLVAIQPTLVTGPVLGARADATSIKVIQKVRHQGARGAAVCKERRR